MRRWIAGTVALALLVVAFAVGAGARPDARAVVSPRVDPAHPPVAWGGPDGRRALDGVWTVDGRRVHVPYSPNAGSLTRASYAGSVATYRTTFAVRGGRYALRFEAVNHRATVWVDGRVVARHAGDAEPFEARVALRGGRHRLAVRADWRDPDAMSAEGWHRAWFNFGGIVREVTIRPVGDVALEAPGIVTRLARGRGGGATVDVSARVRRWGGDDARAVRVEGTLGGRPLAFPPVRVRRGGAAAVTVHARVRVGRGALWSPGRPTLEVLHLALAGGGAGWTGRVGLRELRWDGGKLRINGKVITLHGASLQEDAPGRGTAS